MQVAGREKFSSTRSDPAFPYSDLTLRAVAIAADVIRDGGTIPATGALIEMTAECGGTTPPNGQQHFDVLPPEPWRFRSRNASPAARIRSATSSGGRAIYSSCGERPSSGSESNGLAAACR